MTENCSQCENLIYDKIVLSLTVIKWWSGEEVNEPSFLVCKDCWEKIKKQLQEKT